MTEILKFWLNKWVDQQNLKNSGEIRTSSITAYFFFLPVALLFTLTFPVYYYAYTVTYRNNNHVIITDTLIIDNWA